MSLGVISTTRDSAAYFYTELVKEDPFMLDLAVIQRAS